MKSIKRKTEGTQRNKIKGKRSKTQNRRVSWSMHKNKCKINIEYRIETRNKDIGNYNWNYYGRSRKGTGQN